MSEYIVDYELIPLKWREGYGLSDVDLTEEIVRCRDCKHRFGCVHFIEIQQEDGDGDMIRCETSPDGYCWRGEKVVNE